MFLSTRWKAAKSLGVDMTLLGWTPEELSAAVAPPANPGPTDPDVISQRSFRRSNRPRPDAPLGKHRA